MKFFTRAIVECPDITVETLRAFAQKHRFKCAKTFSDYERFDHEEYYGMCVLIPLNDGSGSVNVPQQIRVIVELYSLNLIDVLEELTVAKPKITILN